MNRTRALTVLAATTVVGSLLQAVSSLLSVGQVDTTIVTVAALGSLCVLVAQLAVTVCVLPPALGLQRFEDLSVKRVVGWSATWVLVAVIASIMSPYVGAVVLVVAACVLAASGLGLRPEMSALAVFRNAPLRAILVSAEAIVIIVLTWVAAVLVGFFFAQVVGAAIMWLCFNLGAVLVLSLWVRTLRRVT